MYDTIHIFLSSEEVKNSDLLSEIPGLLTNVTQGFRPVSNSTWITGNLKNCKLTIKKEGVSIRGSLCKYMFGNNIQTLDRLKTKEAITMLSDELHLPLYKANLTRVDFAANLQMDNEPSYYYPFLGIAGRYLRLEQNNGVYYRKTGKQMLFYDKKQEQKINRMPITDVLKDKNLLRYELKFEGRLCKQFNLSEVKLSTLYDEKFYVDIGYRWRSEYLQIKKYKMYDLDEGVISNLKDFDKLIYQSGITQIGGEAAMLQLIEQVRKRGIFKNKMQIKRCKDKVSLICNAPRFLYESEAIKELDKKINSMYELCS